jgi:hypothetical protein
MNENLILRMFYDLFETRNTLSATLQHLAERGANLDMLADKSRDLEAFSSQYHAISRSQTTCCPYCVLFTLCFVFSVTLGVVIVSFMSVS